MVVSNVGWVGMKWKPTIFQRNGELQRSSYPPYIIYLPLNFDKIRYLLSQFCSIVFQENNYRQSFKVVAGSPKRINDLITPVEMPLL